MRICFWGTRGSIAKAGPSTIRYGGNTSCVEAESAAGTLVVLDCGTGAHGLGQALLASGRRPLRGHVLISHTHWDHIQGFPFFAPLFEPGNEWDVYAPRGFAGNLRDTLAGQMQYTYFPVSLDRLGATIRYHELVEGALALGEIRVTTQYLNHTALALGYRLEADGVSVVYATDHEPYSRALAGAGSPRSAPAPRHPGEDRHLEFVAGADLLIHDSQYTTAEYAEKAGWGHSPIDYVLDIAIAAGVKRLALFHHDPLRDDAAIDRLVAAGRRRVAAAGSTMELMAAAEGLAVELLPTCETYQAPVAAGALGLSAASGSITGQVVIVAVADGPTADLLADAIRPDGMTVLEATDGDGALRLATHAQPGLVILDRNLPGESWLDLCRALRAKGDTSAREVPLVLVAAIDDPNDVARGAEAGVSDWLVKPFSAAYVRTKVRAWLLRTRSRWMKAPLPPDEPRRLRALRRLNILDTPAEERFDRLTRLAQRLFQVPIALVSLVDADRQWFKAHQGLEARETPREMAFCAHAILQPDTLVVPDALQDPRFADNPLVTGDPRVRFYAGQPLAAPDGSHVGTLCIIDRRPRELDQSDLQALRDLAALVEEQLGADADR